MVERIEIRKLSIQEELAKICTGQPDVATESDEIGIQDKRDRIVKTTYKIFGNGLRTPDFPGVINNNNHNGQH